ncbi:MAG: response regulator [Caldilineaceae bacterium]
MWTATFTQKQTHILLVEDDDVDAEAIVRAFRKQQITNPFTIVKNGVEALELLRGQGIEQLQRPYIILLDINMPQMNGLEFLEELRRDDKLRHSIVFVLTTSNRDEDKLAAYDKQIVGYLLKSNAGKDFLHIIALLDSYCRTVEFPPEPVK